MGRTGLSWGVLEAPFQNYQPHQREAYVRNENQSDLLLTNNIPSGYIFLAPSEVWSRQLPKDLDIDGSLRLSAGLLALYGSTDTRHFVR